VDALRSQKSAVRGERFVSRSATYSRIAMEELDIFSLDDEVFGTTRQKTKPAPELDPPYVPRQEEPLWFLSRNFAELSSPPWNEDKRKELKSRIDYLYYSRKFEVRRESSVIYTILKVFFGDLQYLSPQT
jgi:hypothetical protein